MASRSFGTHKALAAVGTFVLLAAASAAPARIMAARAMVALPGAAPAPAAGGGAGGKAARGLHLPRTRQVGFNYQMTDGAGFRWDIQYYGTVGSGTNNAYSGGMYCQVNGNQVRSSGQGWVSQDGREIEIGPYSTAGLKCWRRIRVYKERGLARWLDIFENAAARPVSVNVRIYSSTCWQIQGVQTLSGGSVGEKDWAFITQVQAGAPAPALLHVFGRKGAEVRPAVQLQHNQIYLNYNLTVPARGTAILCHFESQGRSLDKLRKLMKDFRPRRALRDLPPEVRRLIVNFPGGTALFEIDLDRLESGDKVVLKNGDPLVGEVCNGSYAVTTLFGELTLPAEKVLGMIACGEEDDAVRYVLTDGQVVCGSPAPAPLAVRLPTGSQLTIPLGDVQTFSYRLSEQRPQEIHVVGPVAVLRTGDQLAFEPSAVRLRFRTRNGTVDLEPNHLVEIILDNPANGVHRAHFRNGSVLGGFLEPNRMTLKLRLGPSLPIGRDMVRRIRVIAEAHAEPPPALSHVVLSNGDELFGRLTVGAITLISDYGTPVVKPANITTIAFSRSRLGRATVRLWNGTVLRGQLKQPVLGFRICPGPELALHASQIVAVARSEGLPPDHVLKRVAELVALLGAESYKDRERATKELSRMDPAVAPALRKHLDSSDPEVRERIRQVLKALGQDPDKPPEAQPPGVPRALFGFGPR
jgi:hypothetical protein